MKTVDELLRNSLINWALEDVKHPIKKNVLLRMGQENWREELYSVSSSSDTFSRYTPIEVHDTKPTEEIEEWYKILLIDIRSEMKKEYIDNFKVAQWGMKRINTTGAYRFGPLNAWHEIFMQFEIIYKHGILFWDIKNYRGKVNPKHFEKFPTIIADVCKKHGHDFLVRKNSKGFGRMYKTGSHSKALYQYFKDINELYHRPQNENPKKGLTIGNDAHGNLFIYYNKKKIFEILPSYTHDNVQLLIKEKENDTICMTVANTNDIKKLNALIYDRI